MTNQIKRAIKPIKAIKRTLPSGKHKVKIQGVTDVYKFTTSNNKELSAVDITFECDFFGRPLVTTEKLLVFNGLETPLQKLIWITELEEDEENHIDLNDLVGKVVYMKVENRNGYKNITDFETIFHSPELPEMLRD